MSRDSADNARYLEVLSEPPVITIAVTVFVAMIGFEAVSPALPRVADSLGISDARVALVMTAFSAPMAVFVPVTGVLADNYGRRRVMVPSLLLFGLGGVAIAGVDTLEAILVLRAVQGLGFAGVLSISVTVLGDLYTGPEGSTVMGVRVSAAGMSSLVVPVTAGVLATIAWQYPFLLHLLAFPAAYMVRRYVPETVGATDSDARVTAMVRTYWYGLRTELVDRDLALLTLGGAIHGISRIVVLTFVPLFVVRELGSTLTAAGLVISLRGATRTIVPPLSGPVTARLSRKQGLISSLLVMAGSTALLPFAPRVEWVGALVVCYIAANALYSPILKEGVTTIASDDHRAGIVTSMYVFQFGGEAIAPAAFGLVLATLGFEPLFLGGALVIGVYTVLILGLFRG